MWIGANQFGRHGKAFFRAPLVITVLLSTSVAAPAQEGASIPDLSSNDVGWIGNGAELGAPPSGPGPVTYGRAGEFPYRRFDESDSEALGCRRIEKAERRGFCRPSGVRREGALLAF